MCRMTDIDFRWYGSVHSSGRWYVYDIDGCERFSRQAEFGAVKPLYVINVKQRRFWGMA